MQHFFGRPFWGACFVSTIAAGLVYAEPPAAGEAVKPDASVAPAGSVSAAAEIADLPSLTKEAEGTFSPHTKGEAAAAKTRLLQAADRLNRYLATGGANGVAWKRYLKWDQMQQQLRAGATPDLAVLDQIHDRYLTDHAGLEWPIWRNVATALRTYIDLSAALADPQPEETFRASLGRLAADLESYGKSADSESLERAGVSLGILERRRQALPLLRAIRQRLSRPNLFVGVSDDLIAAGSRRQIDEVDAVRDVILGTSVRGQGRTVGSVSVRLTPSADKAVLETTLEATNSASTIGANGPARIGSTSRTVLVGRQQLALDELGFHSLPPQASASARSRIYGVWSTRRGIVDCIVRKAARRRIPGQKRQSELIASRHAEQRLVRRLSAETSRELKRSNADYLEKVRNPLVRIGQFPRQLAFRTTADRLHFTVLHDGPDRLAAPSPPPEVPPGSDLTVRFHESLPNNFAHGLLAGHTLDRDQVERLAVRYLGRIPEQLEDEDRSRGPWSITFAAFNPVTLRLDRQMATITVRGREFASDVRQFDVAMDVTARYRLENQDGKIKAVRQGDLEIFPPGFVPNSGRRLPTRLIGIRNLLKHRFDRIFPEEFVSRPLILPGQWQRVGRLDLVQLQSDRGWLNLGWRPASSAESRLVRQASP
ncbi:MAG TPA: hypothetical protein VHC19_14225 [Pirellulales bacterium]|nr:hypothetical protein [Pirellulales bacterium]